MISSSILLQIYARIGFEGSSEVLLILELAHHTRSANERILSQEEMLRAEAIGCTAPCLEARCCSLIRGPSRTESSPNCCSLQTCHFQLSPSLT